MIGLSLETKDEMLDLFRINPYSRSSRELTVGLFDGQNEISDPRYERLPCHFGAPQSADNDMRFIENVNEIRFDDMGRDHAVDHWGIFDERGNLMALYRLSQPREVPAEDNFVFRVGRLRIGLP